METSSKVDQKSLVPRNEAPVGVSGGRPSWPPLRSPIDPLKHFSKDKPGWKLAALLIHRLGPILAGLGAFMYAAKAAGFFH